ncbi:MAG: hypothetical protein J2P37_25965, partial [Ktedonobacteraceae bacterium]|nr:hypothetical protein [Ktedonobacteraceae bacterium]
QNPPDGVIVTYYLKEQPEGEIKLSFLDASGQEIKSFSSEEAQADTQKEGEAKKNGNKEPRLSKEAGINRFVWNMRYPNPTRVEQGFMGGENVLVGPVAAPDTYQVQLVIGDQNYTASFEIQKDPRVQATQQDLEAQFTLLLRIRDKLSETHEAITTLRDIRQQIEQWEQRTQESEQHDAIVDAGKAVKEKLAAIEEELIQVKAKTRQDTLNYPAKLNAKLAALTGIVASADAAPTEQAYDLFGHLAAQVQLYTGQLQEYIDTDLTAFNKLIRESELPAVLPPVLSKHQKD